MIRVQIYTNDREQPIDLTVKDMRAKAREIHTNDQGNERELPVDQTMRRIIKDPTVGISANLLFTTDDGSEGAVYLNTEKVAAIVTSWSGSPDQAE